MNKYHNKKISSPDGEFDSKYEYEEWCRLKLLERAKIISNLTRQVPFVLIPSIHTTAETLRPISYIADFVYEEKGITYIYESKGYKTKEYLIKKRLLLEKYVVTGEYVFIESLKGKEKVYKKV